MIKQAYAFQTENEPLMAAKYGSGHINTTYLVVDHQARQYILQKINSHVFKKPDELMQNIKAVTDHLQSKVHNPRSALSLIPTMDGAAWHVDEDGETWRMYPFIVNSLCMQKAQTPQIFKESGIGFGTFQNQLSDFPAHNLYETIPHFHDTPKRYERFKTVLADDPVNRAGGVAAEIEFALGLETYAQTLMNLLHRGDLPLRVTHNDTKLNNVLLDYDTHQALCVIDLDTVMPGLSVNDFGDSIRFGANTAAEDETDLSKVNFSLELFKAYADGFLHACGERLTDAERAHLCDGAKMMTLECGLRFLTDYLEGDVYFKTHRPHHNLDRCKNQFALVKCMDKQWKHMQDIIQKGL